MQLGDRLGHLTYSTLVHPGDTWMKAGIDALPPPHRQMVEDILSAMSEILDELRAHYPGLEEQHEDVSHAGEFDELVSHLRDFEERRANPPY